MNHTIKPNDEAHAAVDQLKRSISDLFEVLGSGEVPEQVEARVQLFNAISDLLVGMKSIWAANETHVALNQQLAELQTEVLACIRELQDANLR